MDPPRRPPLARVRRTAAASAAALWNGLLSLVWPSSCVHCGAPDRELCPRCRARLRRDHGRVARRTLHSGLEVLAAGPYAGVARSALVALKHGGRTGLAPVLGGRLRAPLAAAARLARGPAPPLVVAIPSRPERERERGFRHIELLLRAAERSGRVERTEPGDRAGHAGHAERRARRALRALPGRRAQVGLDAAERRANAQLVAVRRRAGARLAGREIILVDDVVTSGATAEAAALALARAGAHCIAVVALCSAEWKRTPRPR